MSNPWIINRQPRPSARVKLFCLAHAGGGATAFRDWGAGLPESIDAASVQLPGRENRRREEPFHELIPLVAELSAALADEIDRPYAIFGHSLGALLAFEAARALTARRQSPSHLFVSAQVGPKKAAARKGRSRLSDAELRRELERLGGTPPEILASDEWMELLLPVFRADFGVYDSYQYQPGPPLACPITAFAGSADPTTDEESLALWSEETTADFRVHIYPGDHFFIAEHLSSVLGKIAGELA